MNGYLRQAEDFLKKTKTILTIDFIEFNKYSPEDKEKRDIYKFMIKRGTRNFSGRYGSSLNDSGYKWRYKSTKNNDYKWQLLPDKLQTKKIREQEKIYKLTNKLGNYPFFKDFKTMDFFGKEYKRPIEPNSYDILSCLTKYNPGTFENFCSEFGYDTDSKRADIIYNLVKEEYKNVCTIWSEKEIEELADLQLLSFKD